MRRPDDLVRPLLVAIAELALPWLWFAWLTRPGVPRPLVTDVIELFAILPPLVAGQVVERAMELRRPVLAAVGIGLSLLSLALLALRVGDAFPFVVLGGGTGFVALGTFGVVRVFRAAHRSEGSSG